MTALSRTLIRLYAALLRLYPPAFRVEFGEEMQTVFAQTLMVTGHGSRMTPFLRELRDLPGSLLRVYVNNMLHGGNMSTQNEYLSPSTRWQAFLGTLPFLAFGLVSMIGEVDHLCHIQGCYTDLIFYLLALIGLGAGWIRGFPLWTYSYLGWSLVFAWWWTGMHIGGLQLFGYTFTRQEAWGWRIWLPLGVTALIALLWTRSLKPLKKMARDIWHDWTRLSLATYTFLAWVFLIYDENHHPYLLAFMAAATLFLSAGAWFFLRSTANAPRVLSLLGGFIGAAIVGSICDATWDWYAYYGIPHIPAPWYMTAIRWAGILSVFAIILFWPVIIALIQRISPRWWLESK